MNAKELFRISARISACVEDGMIACVESGRDCDCVEYSGRVSLVPANMAEYAKYANSVYDNAEGPVSIEIMRPSAASGIRPVSRDLVLEAYENGNRFGVSL